MRKPPNRRKSGDRKARQATVRRSRDSGRRRRKQTCQLNKFLSGHNGKPNTIHGKINYYPKQKTFGKIKYTFRRIVSDFKSVREEIGSTFRKVAFQKKNEAKQEMIQCTEIIKISMCNII